MRAIIHKKRKSGTVGNLPKTVSAVTKTTYSKSYSSMAFPGCHKRTQRTFKELQASLAPIKVSADDSTIRKTLGKKAKSHCWPKRTQRHISHLSDNILIIPETLGKVFCGLMRQNDFTPTVKHALGSVMVWSCFSASGPGRLVIIEPWRREFCQFSTKNP